MTRDYSKLKGRIVEKFDSNQKFGQAMGWSDKTTSYKINGKIEWKQSDIERACDKLNIPPVEIPDYFFCY